MKLYAFSTPEIPKHNGYLKIGETNGDIQKRLDKECHELNVELKLEWDDVVSTECRGIDKMVHRYLVDQGFHIQVFDRTGRDTEWIKCDVADVEKAFRVIKTQIDNKELQREEVGKQFYLEIRNWFYWTAKTGDDPYSVAEPEYTLRLIVRLLLCFFLQEKGLVPKELFDEDWINAYLKENEGYRYYNAILRNLFFHCLNTPIKERKTFESVSLFKNPSKVKEQFQKVPFLNGGLFNEISGDDFALDNYHFFADRHIEHIYELGGDYEVEGIVRLLSKYKYKLSLDDLIDHSDYANVIDPEFIGKVFESLLACIDADTKENRRKTTGSFYTPREIVDYMVNESLDRYLQNDSGKDLMDCKILDPACGSGAFPCGIMNEIIRRLDPDKRLSQNERYHKKLEILKKVIYGVDIQPIAVQITVLRLFLSLIQEIVPDKKKDNYGVEPLPNLETKFICANTLIGLQKEKQQRLELPIIKTTIKQLQLTREQHLMANNLQEKKRLQEFDESLRKLLSNAMEDAGDLSHETAELILQWNPYDQTKSTPFFDPQYMFGIKEFHIVIGNPPYNVIDTKERLKETYEKIYSHLKSGRINIYQLFFGRSTTLLSPKGILSFIHPKTLLTDAYLAATRKYLLEKFASFSIVNIVSRKATFESVLQSVVVSQWNKGTEDDCQVLEVKVKDDFAKKQFLSMTKKHIVTESGMLLIAGRKEIYAIERKCRKVKRLDIKFATGSTEWNKIKNHLSGKKNSGSKRLIYGENIQRFRFEQSKKRAEKTYINGDANVPTLQQLAIVTQRTTSVEQPYRIIATIINPNDFEFPIVTENHTNVFVCKKEKTDIPVVTENGTNVCVCDDENVAYYILGIISSRLMDFYFRLFNSNTHVSSGELNALPIIDVSKESQKQLIKLVKRRLKGEDVDDKIDALVYEFYGLTDKEIKIVKGE